MKEKLELVRLREQAGEVTAMLKMLANQDRLLILCHLVQQELNVSDIETATGITQPTLSQQLTILRRSEVVLTRREGKQIYYAIADQRVVTLMQTLYGLYCC
ncbi:ArsR/SmtB family transcription factor [Alkanindiges illinoisensis]|uniref:Transcriptional regulator n=1 Tax=Alkanindiges illinoisensis TaxID=197183 RepID=A0A4Y7XDF8_9GAMM|nr:metalloregulator ArsR/SmtB family transcription factor [Alkanindiges illinoisensis]TEU28566.1 transcriptional regulator [Alkanindiges illinoisensis]